MALGQKLQFMKLALYFATVKVAVNASQRMARDVHPPFECGPHGIKHHSNKTLGMTVHMTCPNSPVKLDAHTEIVCKVRSSTFAKITWSHDGQPISKHHMMADWKTCNQTLKIKFAKTTDSGKYTCQVANISATVSKTCNLYVKADKTKDVHIEYLKITGNRQTALLQGTVELKCSMFHADVAMWQWDRKNCSSRGRCKFWHGRAFGKHGMNIYLRITNVTKNDEGWYMCLGYKNGIKANKTIYLKTEPCPSGYFCPHDGNTVIPCPKAIYTSEGENNSVSEEMKKCFKTGNGKTPAAIRSRGSSLRNHGNILIFLYAIMTFYRRVVCIR